MALGIPIHTRSRYVYKLIGILSLNEYRQLASSAKYITKAITCDTHIKKEILLQSDIDFPKRAKSIVSQQTIATYTKETFQNCKMNIKEIDYKDVKPTIAPWELPEPIFDLNFTDIKKMKT